MLMQRQGSDVVCAYDYRGLRGKELAATEKCGDGLVEKITLDHAKRTERGKGALWVFDGNDFPHEAEDLKEHGETVLGTSVIGQRLEDDRDYALQIAEEMDFAIPESQEFTDYDPAIQWLKERADRAFVYKPDKQDPTMTYVPLDTSDPERANEELRQYLESLEHGKDPKFVLQEVVDGVEANVELWLHDGNPILAFLDLESKRKLVGDLGENIGCAGDYLRSLALDDPLVEHTAARYLAWDELNEYTGSVDANVMIADNKFYFLENCFRFGYNAYPTIFHQLALAPMETILRRWTAGQSVIDYFAPGFGGSLTLVIDHPKPGIPILIHQEAKDATYLYRAYESENGLAMVDEWPEIACVTAYGETIADAGALCLERAEGVAFPGKGYRVDLADDDLPTLPAARYHSLVEMGLVTEPVEVE
jgi:phosphoribosylamine-glycine ligase